jgi:hypothetical protein
MTAISPMAVMAKSPRAKTVAPNQTGLNNVQGFLGAQAGNYSFVHYDKGSLQADYLNKIDDRNKADKEYFLNAVQTIESQFEALLTQTVYGKNGLRQMSVDAEAGIFTPIAKFATALNEYMMQKTALEAKIASLTSIVGSLPSHVAINAEGSGLKNVPNYGNINFENIKNFYASRLAKVDEELSNLPQKLTLANGNPHIMEGGAGTSLSIPKQLVQLSSDQIKKMRYDVFKAKNWGSESKRELNDYTVYVKRLVQTFIKDYGTTERFRFHNQADEKHKADLLREIADAFYARSYLRAVYGMPLGTIGISYQKRTANIDKFTVSTEALSTMMMEPVWDETNLNTIQQAYYNALEVSVARSSGILTGNTGLLNRANALLTYLGGYSQLADVTNSVLQLMAADLYEEKLIITAGGLAKMQIRYKERYSSSEQAKKYYKTLHLALDPPAPSADGNSEEDPNADVGVVSASSVNGYFQKALIECKNKQGELLQAKQLEAQIAIASGAADSAVIKASNKRIGNLDN